MSETTKTTEQRIFDRLAEIGLDIDKMVLRFIDLTNLLPKELESAAARKCGTLEFGEQQNNLIKSLEAQVRLHYTLLNASHTAIVAAEKRIARERSRSAKLMNTIKKLRRPK